MIELIQPIDANLVAVRASGQVTAQDYERVLIPALKDVLAAHPKARVLYQVDPDTHFTAGAIWDDATFGLGHVFSFERLALVSDTEWINNSVKALGFLMPFPVRLFALQEAQAALDWLAE